MNSNKRFLKLFFLIVFANCSAQSTFTSEYFPLIEGSTYHYQGEFNNKKYKDSYLVRRFKSLNQPIVYYFQKGIAKNNNGLFGHIMFGNGMYFIDEKQLWTVDAFSTMELYKLDYKKKQKLLPQYSTKGSSLELDSNYRNSKDVVSIEKYENINVPAGQFEHCMKIKIVTKWNNGDIDESYVWLAKNIGVIKWIKSTGRVDELVSYQLKHL